MTANDLTRVEEKIAGRIAPAQTGQMVVGTTGLAIRDMSQLLEFAKIMAISGVAVPKYLRGNPGACIAICLQAIEWQMSPYAVARKSYNVNDQIAYEAQLINAVLLRRAAMRGRPVYEFLGHNETRQCRVTVTAQDGQKLEYTSPAVGQITVKNSPLWKADTDQQLAYFSVRSLARRHFPDIILGVIEREEARLNAIEGEVADDEPVPAEKPAASTRRSAAQRLDDLAGDEPEYVDENGVIHNEGPDIQQEQPPAPGVAMDADPLMSAAAKGPRALKLALGKLTQEDFEALPKHLLKSLNETAKLVAMKTGESDE